MMIKRVNVRTNTAIRNIEPPIYRSRDDIKLSTRDIKMCLLHGAYVYEILNDGSTIRLNLNNYNRENNKAVSPVIDYSKEVKEEPVVISNINNEEIPVISETPVVEEPAVEETVVEEPTVEETVVEETVETVEETTTNTNKTSTSKKKKK